MGSLLFEILIHSAQEHSLSQAADETAALQCQHKPLLITDGDASYIMEQYSQHIW